MIDSILLELRMLDDAENMFGEELLDSISYTEQEDTYLIRVKDYPYMPIEKDDDFNSSYFNLISYLTVAKNEIANGTDPEFVTGFYLDWIKFKTAYNVRKAWFYHEIEDLNDDDEIREKFIEILGLANYIAVDESLNTPPEDFRALGDIVMNYVGNTRAVRDLCIKYLDTEQGSSDWAFHLWHMTAHELIERFGYIFYLGNEMGGLEYCPYDYTAQEYYYEALYRKMVDNAAENIPGGADKPGNSQIIEKRKNMLTVKMVKEIFGSEKSEAPESQD